MGLSGVIGGLLLFLGDMLYYYDPISTNFKQNMGNNSDIRIMFSGVTALLATWFYLVGLVPVYHAFKPSSGWVRNTVIASFAAILTAYGVIHGAYLAIATTSKLAIQHNLDVETATALASGTNELLRSFVYPPFVLLSLFFIAQVWKKKTLYPRWIIFFFPLIPFALNVLFGKYLTGCAFIIIEGGFFNLILVLFFAASTAALWNPKQES